MEEFELVRGLRLKEDGAVREYLARYRSLFHHCIGHFEADPARREDLFQELSWFALDRLDQASFDPERGSFGTWLYRVAWCRCVDLKRQQNGRRKVQLTLASDAMPDRPDPAAGPGEVVGDAEIEGLVRRALALLEGEDRSLLQLRFVDGRTLVEIARALSITIEQAKYRLKRASSELRRELLKHLAREEALE